jgi:hypothetical protein
VELILSSTKSLVDGSSFPEIRTKMTNISYTRNLGVEKKLLSAYVRLERNTFLRKLKLIWILLISLIGFIAGFLLQQYWLAQTLGILFLISGSLMFFFVLRFKRVELFFHAHLERQAKDGQPARFGYDAASCEVENAGKIKRIPYAALKSYLLHLNTIYLFDEKGLYDLVSAEVIGNPELSAFEFSLSQAGVKRNFPS